MEQEKIEERLAMALTHSEQGSYDKNLKYVQKALQEYGNHIRQQTLEEAMKCVPAEVTDKDYGENKPEDALWGKINFNACRKQTISNLQKLKDKN